MVKNSCMNVISRAANYLLDRESEPDERVSNIEPSEV